MGTSSTVATPLPSSQECLPSFDSWLKHKANILTLPVLIAILNLMVNLASRFMSNSVPEVFFKDSLFKSHFLQACLLLVLLLSVPKSFESINPIHDKAKRAADEFRSAWLFTLFSWLILYIIFSFEKSPLLKDSPHGVVAFLHVAEAAASCLSTLGFWRCFLIVSNPDQKADYWKWSGIIIFLVALKAIAVSFGSSASLDFVTSLSIGALSGVAMAFFIGRLESRLLLPPRWLLMALYCYAVLQFGYGFLEVPIQISTNWQPFFFFFVLLLKILLALFVYWLIGTGNLLFYLRYMSELNQDYPDRRLIFVGETSRRD
jgi:hypothetical protein